MVDLATNYSFLAAAPKVYQDSAIRAVTEFIQNIRDQFGDDGSWPHDEPFILISDSGTSRVWRRASRLHRSG